MDHKILGKTKFKISPFGFGALPFSRIPENDAVSLVREAIDMGINLIDTAHDYPNSEYILGKALKGIRDKVIISTKSSQTEKKASLGNLETSLKLLGSDFIDIFLFHDVSKPEKFEKLISNGTVEALLKEKQKGKINYIGFSCHSPQIIERFYEVSQFSVLMLPINYVSTEFTEDTIYKKLIKNNIGLLGMKPLGGGRLIDAGLSFRYINQFKEVIPVIGIESSFELKQNLKLIERRQSLNSIDMERIKEIKNELGKKFCRGCGYCMPCDHEINIVTVNIAKILHKQFSTEKFFSPEISCEIDKVDDCIECGECEDKCPYNLNIIEMLKENRDFYNKEKQNI